VFPREIIGSSDWLASLWERRDRIADKRATLVWGQKDIAFRTKELARWRELFPEARVVTLDDVGHFVSEEAPEVLVDELTRLLI
jgi:haloalkane dehalogenase